MVEETIYSYNFSIFFLEYSNLFVVMVEETIYSYSIFFLEYSNLFPKIVRYIYC